MSSHTPKNIQEGSAEIIYEDIGILSHPNLSPSPLTSHLGKFSHYNGRQLCGQGDNRLQGEDDPNGSKDDLEDDLCVLTLTGADFSIPQT